MNERDKSVVDGVGITYDEVSRGVGATHAVSSARGSKDSFVPVKNLNSLREIMKN